MNMLEKQLINPEIPESQISSKEYVVEDISENKQAVPTEDESNIFIKSELERIEKIERIDKKVGEIFKLASFLEEVGNLELSKKIRKKGLSLYRENEKIIDFLSDQETEDAKYRINFLIKRYLEEPHPKLKEIRDSSVKYNKKNQIKKIYFQKLKLF